MGFWGFGEGLKRRASDLSKVKDLSVDDMMWYKKQPNGKENLGRFVKLVNHEKGIIEVGITDKKGMEKFITLELNRYQWGTLTNP